MSDTIQEEILGVLYLIAALLAFGMGYNVIGWLVSIMALISFIGAMYHAVKEIKENKQD